MATLKIINATVPAVFIGDVGVEIPAGIGSFDAFTDPDLIRDLCASGDLRTLVLGGTLTLSDGVNAISISDLRFYWQGEGFDYDRTYAAERIVSLVPEDGTDLTIAAAIAALPAAGGTIFIKQGTYPIAASLVPTNKPITFIGAGAGAVIDLGANAISAFLINFDQRYSFSNFKILGSGIAGQTAFEFNIGSSSGQEVTAETVLVDNIEKTFLIAGTDFPLVHTTMCFFKVANLATSRHWDGVGEWHGTDTICTFTGFTHRGGITGGPDLYWVNCEINLTGDGAVNFVQMDRCKFQNGTLVIAAQGSLVCNSLFDSTVALARFIDLPVGADSVVIIGCEFGSITSEHIRIATTLNIVAGCPGCIVTEIGAANDNDFSNLAAGTIIGTTTNVTDWNTRDIAASVTLDIRHRTALVDATAAARVITLPTAASSRYRVYTIKKIDASVFTVTIDPAGAETIDGAATVILLNQNDVITIQSDGTTWKVLSSSTSSATVSISTHETYQFGRDAIVPAAGSLQLYAPGLTLLGFRAIRGGTITGLSLRVNVLDAVRSYRLEVRKNGVATAALVALPSGSTSVSTGALSVAYALGDVITLFMVLTAGAGDSTFIEEEAVLEVAETQIVAGGGTPNTRSNRTVAVSGALLTSDQVVFADASGGAITLTLPNPVLFALKTITIKKIDATANAVTISQFAAELIDGGASVALTVQYQSIDLYCDGTNWSVV
jgi:hypothetical protein